MNDSSDDTGRGRRSKVARLIDEYALEGMGAELERRWTAEIPDERLSLRELAAEFNRELLRTAMTDAGAQPLDGEVENTYRLLTDDDVGGADRTRARRRLERAGVDIDALTDDFVSYQAVRTYLTEHRDAEYASEDADPTESAARTVRRLRSRTATVTEDRLDGLRKSGAVTLGDFRVIVNTRVVCEDCGNQYGVENLLETGGCDCT